MNGTRILVQGIAVLALWAGAASFSVAQDGRLSLAERVARLEQQHNDGAQQATLELLNLVNQLQTEIQRMNGIQEEQQFRFDELKQQLRDQAMDFDARLERLENTAPTGQGQVSAGEGSAAAQPQATSAGAAEQGQSSSPEPRQEPQDPAAERAAYDLAFEALKNGQYAESARRFQSFLQQFPQGDYAPNAQYWLGESYYVTQNYPIALEAFERLLSRFPNSNKAADALLKVGYCHYEMRNWSEAEASLNRVVQRYPDSTVSRLAQGRLRALRMENR